MQESFYAQHQLEALDMNNNLVEEMQEARSGKNDLEIRALLGAFLFSGDTVDKKIKVLSGGEKARVALAKTIASKANFLMLDEPTNHLDIHSVELLAESLIKYEGSLILVSHDRYFISKIANKIWEIEDKEIKEFKGSYQEWEYYKAQKEKAAKPAAEPSVKAKPVEEKLIDSPKASSSQHNEQKKKIEKVKRRFDKAEELVNKLENKKAELETQLGNPEIYGDLKKFNEVEAQYKTQVLLLTNAKADYEKLFEELMALEAI